MLGGSRVGNVRLLDSTYRAGWRTYAFYSLENAAFFSATGTITFGVGTGFYYGGAAAYNYVNGTQR